MVAVRKGNRALERAQVLERLIKEHGWRKGAELGVFRGDTYKHLLRSCDLDLLVGVDVWRPLPESRPILPGGRSYEAWPLEEFYQNLLQWIDETRLVATPRNAFLLRMLTADAAGSYLDGFFDFVFIDADHTAPGLTADILAWLPKVKMDGWVLGHDYNIRKFPSVVHVVDTLFPRARQYPDHVWGSPKSEAAVV